MYRELFGTVASCPHCGGFRNRGSPLLEVPLYYCVRTYAHAPADSCVTDMPTKLIYYNAYMNDQHVLAWGGRPLDGNCSQPGMR